MVAALGLILLLAAGPAGEAALAPAFGAAIVSTHPDGRKARLWLKADHTWRAEGRKGNRSSGVWKVKGGKLCLSQKKPFAGPFSYCKAIPRIEAGKPWKDTAFNGEPVVNEIVR